MFAVYYTQLRRRKFGRFSVSGSAIGGYPQRPPDGSEVDQVASPIAAPTDHAERFAIKPISIENIVRTNQSRSASSTQMTRLRAVAFNRSNASAAVTCLADATTATAPATIADESEVPE